VALAIKIRSSAPREDEKKTCTCATTIIIILRKIRKTLWRFGFIELAMILNTGLA
jgi:hypothetical protein